MTAPCFYLDSDVLVAREVVLGGSEGHHAVTVKRLRVGEEVLISNGRGWLGVGHVTALRGRGSLVIHLHSALTIAKPSPTITVAMAVIKGERLERAIEQLTEIGVDQALLFAADRAVVRSAGGVGEALLAKLRRRAVEAMKQSRRGWLMQVDAVPSTVALAAWIGQPQSAGAGDAHATTNPSRAFVLDVDATDSLPARAAASPEFESVPRIVVVIGPEGGLTPTELECLKGAGAGVVRLGDSVMRSGTAAVAGAVAVSLAAGRWQTDVS